MFLYFSTPNAHGEYEPHEMNTVEQVNIDVFYSEILGTLPGSFDTKIWYKLSSAC